ncbi:prostaglandin E synthase 3 [Nematostella vectensis]|uniref:prostaglandin E synthase 3 n=1 Tax=Nematostella vectensis TaxID=45351 RepID=UPI00138FDC1B|nr:prostaglandin E synthase 3 [Nematostella vectensis]
MDPILHPLTLWAQRKDKILLTISLVDCKDPQIELTEKNLTFRCHGGAENKEYVLELEFFKEIVPQESTRHKTSREITFTIKKKEEGPYWTSLLKSGLKNQPHYIKTDFSKWKDEDDSDEDKEMGDEANFEDMVAKMGGAGVGGEDPGVVDSDDSDDEGLPDLEG